MTPGPVSVSVAVQLSWTLAAPVFSKYSSVMGVAPPGSSHRKPQHLLYCYATNQIDDVKLDGFCELVQSCFAMGEDKP